MTPYAWLRLDINARSMGLHHGAMRDAETGSTLRGLINVTMKIT